MDYNRANLIARIIIICLLITIAGLVIKNKVGQDCDYDLRVTEVSSGITYSPQEIIDYFFENKLGVDAYSNIGFSSFNLTN
jgi:hypothetical protein